jgi:D-alanyl-D-alanine carboxypeptidase
LLSLGGTPLLAQTGTLPSAHDTVAPVSDALCRDMRSTKVLNPGAPVGCERLQLVRFNYLGFDGATRDDGELVVLDAVADHVLSIFVALRGRSFPIASAHLMNRYRGDDDASMARNNTSAFNVRRVEGSNAMSLHAYGLAIDINPIQNPYVERGARGIEVSPPAGNGYVTRRNQRPGTAEAVVDLFAHHGFAQWGGYWPRGIDYQHFQVGRRLAGLLVTLSHPKARATFEQHVERVRACIQAARQRGERTSRACAAF